MLSLDSLLQAVTALSDVVDRTENPAIMAGLDEILRRGVKSYDEEVAEEVYRMAVQFVPVVKDLLVRLEARNV